MVLQDVDTNEAKNDTLAHQTKCNGTSQEECETLTTANENDTEPHLVSSRISRYARSDGSDDNDTVHCDSVSQHDAEKADPVMEHAANRELRDSQLNVDSAAEGNDMTEPVVQQEPEKMGWRRINACLDRWPRCTAIICRIIVPLWFLIGISLGLGLLLSQFEAPQEYEQNDQILMERFLLERFPSDDILEFLQGMPRRCMDYYLYAKSNKSTFEDEYLPVKSNGLEFRHNAVSTLWNLPLLSNKSFPEIEISFENSTINSTLNEMSEYVDMCVAVSGEMAKILMNYTQSTPHCSQLSFNWIRCWNYTLYGGVNPYIASAEQINAADNQTEFYSEVWKQDQGRLFHHYLTNYSCTGDDLKCVDWAYRQSVAEASGRWMCNKNTGGSSWFWFTVMTTIGYGNQAPVTSQGRALVSGLGWVSIIAFGGVAVFAGKVIGIIVDDFFTKTGLKVMARPIIGAMIWAGAAVCWLILLAQMALDFWNNRVPNLNVDNGDSLWFSYITTLTVGLGDYYLQPEVMFVSDVFNWSLLILFGSVMLTTFLGKVGDIFEEYSPAYVKKLRRRLARTDMVRMKIYEIQEKNMLALEAVSELVELMESDCTGLLVENSLRKKEIFFLLLEQTVNELEYFAEHGTRVSDSMRNIEKVVEEERILRKILKTTIVERKLLEDGTNKSSAKRHG